MHESKFIPINTKFNFIVWRKTTFIISSFIIIISIISIFLLGINYGIDFKGGFLIEIRTNEKPNLTELRTKLKKLNLGTIKLQSINNNKDVMIRIERQKGGEKSQNEALTLIKHTLGNKIEYRRIDSIGPTVSKALKRNGIKAVSFALIAMLIYIWFRFEWQFGLCAVIALIHDLISILGFYSILQLNFNETAIIVLLTIIGYSINDTVVVYDRIRENFHMIREKIQFSKIINKSINETLSRTILTSGSTILSLLALYCFGGPVISSFSLPIIFGIIVGTYSSIFLASLLLLTLKTPYLNK